MQALGKLNGAIVVSDANTGRILAMVNQKLALKSGFQPCSTVKVPVALAALSESVVDRDTQIRLYGKTSMAMTEALAKSSNQYFASLGEKLGFERMSYYARLFGLGEKAGLDIDAEQAGHSSGIDAEERDGHDDQLRRRHYADAAGIRGAAGSGGQRRHAVLSAIPEIAGRSRDAAASGEAASGDRGSDSGDQAGHGRARWNMERRGASAPTPNEPIYGKTGTCTDTRTPTHLGWFGSFTEANGQKVVVVVLLTGGSAVSGPAAAGVAGQVYKNLEAASFFAQGRACSRNAAAKVGTQISAINSRTSTNFVLSNASSRDIMYPCVHSSPCSLLAAVSLGTFALVAQAPQGGGGKGRRPSQESEGPPGDDTARPLASLMRVYWRRWERWIAISAMTRRRRGKDSDANPKKLKARMMIQMVKDINKKFPRRQRARDVLHLPSRQPRCR